MKKIVLLFLAISIIFGCQKKENEVSDLPISIIPLPEKMEQTPGVCVLENITITDFSVGENWDLIVETLQKGIKVKRGNFVIEKSDKIQNKEGYHLSVKPDEVRIRASDPQGVFYAVQTLLQLLPPEIFSTKKEESIEWKIPCIEIEDSPRFEYRGMHLDVARHFFGVEEVKKYIDQLAARKMNYFHWHLTEDQGWRIEIKKYPKLTEIGGFRNGTLIGHYNDNPQKYDGKKYGGFYTQEEIKEVVAYAKKKFITVIPEIELPGHAQAAIAAYPELGCTGKQLEVLQKWGISDNVYLPSEATFEFLENVLTEVVELFPSKYIHIGGDECPKTQWKESAFCQNLIKEKGLKDEHGLQSYFIGRIEKFLNSKGRQIIGWDEILEGGLAPNATVMSWRGIEGGIEAAKQKHNVIMTPTSHCYFDYYQSDHPDEPLAIGGFLPLEKVYNYEPIPEELTEEEAKYIIGTQANVWTEYMPDFKQVEYMIFPRMDAIAEVAWSQKKLRDFDGFIQRMTTQMRRYKMQGINAADHFYDLKSSITTTGNGVVLELKTLATDAEVFYSNGEEEPRPSGNLSPNKITVNESGTLKAQAFKNGESVGRPWQTTFDFHKAAGKKIKLEHQPHKKYSGNGNASVINGVLGSNERYGDAEWLGFNGKDFEAVIDLGEPTIISGVTFRFFNGEGQWIYLPKEVRIAVSEDGEKFMELGWQKEIAGDEKVVEVLVNTRRAATPKKPIDRFLKVTAKNFGIIPDGKQGGGNPAWLFVDEIQVN